MERKNTENWIYPVEDSKVILIYNLSPKKSYSIHKMFTTVFPKYKAKTGSRDAGI